MAKKREKTYCFFLRMKKYAAQPTATTAKTAIIVAQTLGFESPEIRLPVTPAKPVCDLVGAAVSKSSAFVWASAASNDWDSEFSSTIFGAGFGAV
jgi:hypothetical protein